MLADHVSLVKDTYRASSAEVTIKTFEATSFNEHLLVEEKKGSRITVCIPARDEAVTIGNVVHLVESHHVKVAGGSGLVDELIVIDDGSKDDTAAIAEKLGARVVQSHGVGKGGAMAKGAEVASGDLIVFLDADVVDMTDLFVTGLVGPLICDTKVQLVKAFYERPMGSSPSGGGRVTELVAKPLLEMFFPDLGLVHQPLAGESALRKSLMSEISFASNYGVEFALLVDIAHTYSKTSIAQVNLGKRTHRNRPLSELKPQAKDILTVALERRDLGAALGSGQSQD